MSAASDITRARRSPGEVDRAVLRALLRHGPQTVKDLVARLPEQGVRRERGAVEQSLRRLTEQLVPLVRQAKEAESFGLRECGRRSGRRPDWAHLSRAWGHAVGVELGAYTLRAGVTDIDGILLSSDKRHHDVRGMPRGETLDRAAKLVGALLDDVRRERPDVAQSPLLGVTLALPAPVNQRNRSVSRDMLRDWQEGDVAEEFATRLVKVAGNTRVRLANDADVRAIGELHYGAARGFRHAAVVKISGGIGCGVIQDGRLLEGAHGTAGEIGHWVVDPARTELVGDRDLPEMVARAECSCGGHGHLQAYASAIALADRLRRHWPSSLAERAEQNSQAGRSSRYEAVFEALAEHSQRGNLGRDRTHEAVQHAVRQVGQILGQALVNLTLLLDPEIIVITGRLALLGPAVLVPIRDALENMLPRSGPLPKLTLGSGGEDEQPWIGVRGAARASIEAFVDLERAPTAGQAETG